MLWCASTPADGACEVEGQEAEDGHSPSKISSNDDFRRCPAASADRPRFVWRADDGGFRPSVDRDEIGEGCLSVLHLDLPAAGVCQQTAWVVLLVCPLKSGPP